MAQDATKEHMKIPSPEQDTPLPPPTAVAGDDLWDSHDRRIREQNAILTRQGGNATANRFACITDYNNMPYPTRDVSHLVWWKNRKEEGKLLPLLQVVNKFGCIPATSVPSECLFSNAGELVDEHRSRIHPNNVNMILFLHNNA